jgi:hypothetical protein
MTDTEIEELQATLRRLTQTCTRLENENGALHQQIKQQAIQINGTFLTVLEATPWMEIIPALAEEAADINRRLQSQVDYLTETVGTAALRMLYILVKRLGGKTTIAGQEVLAVMKGASVNVTQSKTSDDWIITIKEPSNERPT